MLSPLARMATEKTMLSADTGSVSVCSVFIVTYCLHITQTSFHFQVRSGQVRLESSEQAIVAHACHGHKCRPSSAPLSGTGEKKREGMRDRLHGQVQGSSSSPTRGGSRWGGGGSYTSGCIGPSFI